MRRSQLIMGTGVTIDIPWARDEQVFTMAFGLLSRIDDAFSPYKSESELCRFQRGEISDISLSHPMKMVKLECERLEKLTDGYFSAYFSGKFDPTGYVKGWAIKKAAHAIKGFRYGTFCVGIGGDILACSNSSKEWKVGIQDPRDKQKIIKNLSISNGAIATSGNYERGPHIINPKIGQPAKKLLSVTVTGPSITKADVLATAVFASGEAKPEFLKNFEHYQVLAIGR